MLAQAFSYIDRVVSSYQKHCCCTSDPRDEQAKSGDLIVFTEWDTREDPGRGLPGYNPQSPDLSDLGAAAAAASSSKRRAEAGATPSSRAGQSLSFSRSPERGHPQPASPPPPVWPHKLLQEEDSTSSSRTSLAAGSRDHLPEGVVEAFELRELMKRFVQEVIRGKPYRVVVEDGHLETCTLCITTALQYLQLRASGVTHDIPLKNVKNVVPGKLLENRFTPMLLDEMCSTIVLKNNECVTFKFDTIKERDEFTKCIKVLALALE